MAKQRLRQFRAEITPDELRKINSDAAARAIDRGDWFTHAIKTSPSWRRLFPKGSKA